jgi:hypothetical protein
MIYKIGNLSADSETHEVKIGLAYFMGSIPLANAIIEAAKEIETATNKIKIIYKTAAEITSSNP